MNWQKKGLIYAPSGDLWWAKKYAMLPTAEILSEEVIRIYFASLDNNLYGRIGYIDLDANNPLRILDASSEPVLDLGELGTFDDSGVNPSYIFNSGNKKYLYYTGWQRSERVPYVLLTGLASSDDGKNFNRISRTPILERTDKEPFLRSAIGIIQEDNLFKAWYCSAIKWTIVNSVQYPNYVIKYATSQDGFSWQSYDFVCINFKDDDEFGLARPWIIRDKDKYLMWYSIRSRTRPYCIGFAESKDGINWIRRDNEVGISTSASGWDSEMVCYPCVVDAAGKRYMFYNGNRHGSTGFGYAVWEN